MQRKNKGNGSSIGTATHTEKLPFRFVVQSKMPKHSKYSCRFYSEERNFCRKLKIACVGVRNELCPQNRLQNLQQKKVRHKPKMKYGSKVKVKGRGTDTFEVVAVNENECVLKTANGTFECHAISDIEVG